MSGNINERRGRSRGGYDIPIKDKSQKWGKLIGTFYNTF